MVARPEDVWQVYTEQVLSVPEQEADERRVDLWYRCSWHDDTPFTVLVVNGIVLDPLAE